MYLFPLSRVSPEARSTPVWPGIRPIVLLAVFLASGCGSSGGDGPSGDTGSTDSGNRLPDLPNPPISPPPSADDEPAAEASHFNTVTNFQVVRDTGPRIPEKEAPKVTLEEYNAGPLEPEIVVPPGLDTTQNRPPFFEGLTDQETLAGQTLSVLFKPVDPDGGIPGMYPEQLPKGAEFVDNMDGSKTLVWMPLQRDVGIQEFTAVAIDPEHSGYRTHHTIRIKIDMPDDPSTIPNVAPELEEFLPHTARVNDPVVLALRGIDLNGPVPTLELPNPPANASFVRHPRYDDYFILRFVPESTGNLSIEVVVRDAVNSSLTSTDSVSLEVLSASDFSRQGSRLRDLAGQRNLRIGYASLQEFFHRPDGSIYADIAAAEFNMVTAENAFKVDLINPEPGRYQFADADNLMTFASLNNMSVRGHPLVWHRQLPDWVLELPEAKRQGAMQEHIVRLMARYPQIQDWDVVNEAIGEDGGLRDTLWLQAMGESYIETAFRQARAVAPDATLLLNDYDIEVDGAKADTLFELLDRQLALGTPIDAIGFQMHLWSNFDEFGEVRRNFQKVADLGLDIHVTELDVALTEDGGTEAQQAAVYRQILAICLEQPRCTTFQMWGFTDQYSWRENWLPLILDKRYQTKPAYHELQQGLAQ